MKLTNHFEVSNVKANANTHMSGLSYFVNMHAMLVGAGPIHLSRYRRQDACCTEQNRPGNRASGVPR
jgi:hypothetical protein